jgi:hypothetical protein
MSKVPSRRRVLLIFFPTIFDKHGCIYISQFRYFRSIPDRLASRVPNNIDGDILVVIWGFIIHHHHHIEHSTKHQPHLKCKRGRFGSECCTVYLFSMQECEPTVLFISQLTFQGFPDVLVLNDLQAIHDSVWPHPVFHCLSCHACFPPPTWQLTYSLCSSTFLNNSRNI